MYSSKYTLPVKKEFERLERAHQDRTDYLSKNLVIEARQIVNGAAEKPSLWIRIVSYFR